MKKIFERQSTQSEDRRNFLKMGVTLGAGLMAAPVFGQINPGSKDRKQNSAPLNKPGQRTPWIRRE